MTSIARFARRARPATDAEPSQWEHLKADLAALYRDFDRRPGGAPSHRLLAAITNPGFQCVALYRAARALYLRGLEPLAWIVQMLCVWLTGGEFLCSMSIGPGLVVVHPVGTGSYSDAGRNLRMFGLAQVNATDKGKPTLGDDVTLGAGSSVLGPVTIGDGAFVGARAVVLTDVPAHHRAVGNPARILPPKD